MMTNQRTRNIFYSFIFEEEEEENKKLKKNKNT